MIRASSRSVSRTEILSTGIPSDYADAKLSDFPEGYQGVATLEKYAGGIVRNIIDGVGLLLVGPSGQGKSRAACALAIVALSRSARTYFLDASTFQTRTFEDRGLRSKAEGAEFLVLDDFGLEHDNVHARVLVEGLIRHRAANRRATITTTNLKKDVLEERYGAALKSVLMGSTLRVLIEGRDWRKDKAADIAARFA
jgi:DNA replication protein DnaC